MPLTVADRLDILDLVARYNHAIDSGDIEGAAGWINRAVVGSGSWPRVLQAEILSIIDDVRAEFGDARFGLGLYTRGSTHGLCLASACPPGGEQLQAIEKRRLLSKSQEPDELKIVRIAAVDAQPVGRDFHGVVRRPGHGPAAPFEAAGQPLVVVVTGFGRIADQQQQFGHA